MQSYKSRTCFSTRTGKALTAYTCEQEAQQGAVYVEREFKHPVVGYECNKCGCWHLALKERATSSDTCPYCRDRQGQSKQLYNTEDDARRRGNIIERERGVFIKVYSCPHTNGWHLTHR